MAVTLPNNWEPRNYQFPAWLALEDGCRHLELIWHRRSGKDDIALHWTATAAFERIGNYWHMLPEYAQARKAIWDAINPKTGKKRVDEAFPLEIRERTNDQQMKIVFKNGSVWQVVGSDDPDSLVGSPPIGIVWSEWALSNPNTRAYLQPIIEENGGWQIFITTPRGRNHAQRTYKNGIKNPKQFAQLLTAHDTSVFSEEQLEEVKSDYVANFGEDYGMAKYEQEYLCSFDAANLGSIIARAVGKLEQLGLTVSAEYDPAGAPIEISVDIGRRDTAVFWFWQPKVGGFSLIDCISGFGADADEWCEKIWKELVDRDMKLGKIHLPHDAKAKTFAAKHSAAEIFSAKFGFDRVGIVPISKISDRINAARKVVERCEFSVECDEGLDGLRAWAYDWNEDTKMFSSVPKHDWASHFGDSFSYGCQVMEQAQPPVEPQKPKFGTDMTFNDIVKMNAQKRRREGAFC